MSQRFSVYAEDGCFITHYRTLEKASQHARSINGTVRSEGKRVWPETKKISRKSENRP